MKEKELGNKKGKILESNFSSWVLTSLCVFTSLFDLGASYASLLMGFYLYNGNKHWKGYIYIIYIYIFQALWDENVDFYVYQFPKYAILQPINQATNVCIVFNKSPRLGPQAAHNTHGTTRKQWVRRHPVLNCREKGVELGLEGGAAWEECRRKGRCH